MYDGELSKALEKQLEEITSRKGHLLREKYLGDKESLKIIDEYLRCTREPLDIRKNLMSLLILISNHLIQDGINRIMGKLDANPEDMLILRLYMYMQMSSNYLDGFLLGHAYLKAADGINIFEYDNLDTLEIFKKIYIIRIKHNEEKLIRLIDERSNLISYFEKEYRQLFLSNSALLADLAGGNIDTVVEYLMLSFFDGILTAKIIAGFSGEENKSSGN
jgi:hypothetical protein